MQKPPQKTALSTQTLLRVSVLIFWLMLGMQIFFQPVKDAKNLLLPLSQLFAMGLSLAFALAFWYNTRNIARQSLAKLPMLLLVIQTLCGFIVCTDFLYIVAAEIPLVLPARAAFLWITGQTLLLTAWIFWLDQYGQGNLVLMNLPEIPHIVVILLTDIALFAIHAFAFFMGYLAASEARGRQAAERLNAELIATRALLEQSSRVAERAYVARELHDSLGHHLVALKVNLELAQNLADGSAKKPVQDSLGMVVDLLRDVREVVGKVRPKPKMELRQALQTLLDGVTEIAVEWLFPEDLTINDPEHAHILFRCVQEAVTNAIKHANARKIWIEFINHPVDITLLIRDDGKGAAQIVPGYGLNGMRERLESAGGLLTIQHSPKGGFTLLAQLPKYRPSL